MKLSHLLSAFALSLLCAASVAAQTPAKSTQHLAWDHSGTDVVKFQVAVDGGTFVDAPGGATVRDIPLPAMTPGQHTLVVKTCYNASCVVDESIDSSGLLIQLRVFVAAGNLRIIDAPEPE
jgi:hypothetical protein